MQTLVRAVVEDAGRNLVGTDAGPVLAIDAEISLKDIVWSLVETLAKFQPFGEGNRRPVFMSRNLEVASCDLVGQTHAHVRCLLRDAEGKTFRFIGFNLGKRIDEFGIGTRLDAAYEVDVNEWNGRREMQGKLVDVRKYETNH